jgi:hypothetical protein
LGAIAEILQIGPALARKPDDWRHDWRGDMLRGNSGSFCMRVFVAAAITALLAGPAYAQTPNVNLIPEMQSKSPEQLEQEAAQQKAYKESLRKIPDAKASSDPWGAVRSAEPARPAAPAKPRTKTGGTANQTQSQ